MAAPVPQDALDYFNAKQLKPSFDYRDVWREEHALNFTVAKAMQLDILQDIQQAVASAIAEGKTFAKFQSELSDILVDKGWWGKHKITDPLTGKTKLVELGSPRRLKIIYDSNLRTARAAQKWQLIQRTKQTMPYLLYQLGPSAKHRDAHVAINNTLLPVDDPFWGIYYPPNGYGCKCWVRQIGNHEYESLAGNGDYNTESPPIEYEDWLNKRTGEIEKVPKGVQPGWDTNPGIARKATLDKLLAEKTKTSTRMTDKLMQSLTALRDNIKQTVKAGLKQALRDLAKVINPLSK
jgi:uncharacterized protein with gpF-like domain